MTLREKPIGVFDSGFGGLTVLKKLVETLPSEDFIYFGDTAHLPYGSKLPEEIKRFVRDIVKFLRGFNVKLIVVACNSSSAIAMEEIKKIVDVPVVGVIEPAVRAALKNTKSRRIGVIGTEVTIKSNAYKKAFSMANHNVKVFQKPCPLFVPLVEEGFLDHRATYSIAEYYLNELKERDIDQLVLGCTHYPLLKKVIRKVMGEGIELVDSSIEVSKEVADILEREHLRNTRRTNGYRKFFVSGSSSKFKRMANKLFDFEINEVKRVNIEKRV